MGFCVVMWSGPLTWGGFCYGQLGSLLREDSVRGI